MCRTLGRLGVGNDDNVVVYDSGSGAIAARAWWLLQWLGHRKVALLDGGYAAWVRAGFATEAGATTVTARQFEGIAQNQLVLQTADVVAADPIARERLFDARDAARFRGDVEPIDTVAGHIPGTRNFPFASSLRTGGLWKTSDELRAEWSARAGEATNADWGVMCGSGVTACHLALSACVAGLKMPRVYVGSWSEWIADSTRPVANGDSEAGGAQDAAEPA
jgi:thiosulfate/3-mercaptopyruvate sulfurtransferase